MRYVLLAALSVLSLQGRLFAQDQEKKSTDTEQGAGVQANSDTIPIQEMDGTILHIVGFGNIFMNYTETIDGYTVVLDDAGLYNYAKLTKTGDLVPNGIVAHDPLDRKKKEIKALRKIPKHLRYQGEVLEKLKKRQQDFNDDINRQ
jgi:hypothetical protein